MKADIFLSLSLTVAAGMAAMAQGRILMTDLLVEHTRGLELCHHRPADFGTGPVLQADREWELNVNGDPYAAPFSGGVWYDEEEALFKMWYSAGGGRRNGLITCYAQSDNGVDWRKPELDYVPGTNIVDTLEHDCVTVLLDKYETDRSRRYKMFCVRFDRPDAVSMVLKYSADGKHWGEPVAVSGDLFDRCSAYYDPFRSKYVLSLKTKDDNNLRARNFLTHADPEMAVSLAHRVYGNRYDKFIRFWFSADNDDPHHPDYPDIAPAVYNHDAIPYESTMLGQFVIWQGPENKDCVRLNVQKRNEILLGYSYDGFNWQRPCKTPFIPVAEDRNAWNAGNIQSAMGTPLIVGDSLYFYYSARYNSRPRFPSNFSTGLAKLRRDGFTSLHAGSEDGILTTGVIEIKGSRLFVNIALKGKKSQLLAEVLDAGGNPVAGFTRADCVPVRNTDSTRLPISWKEGSISDLTLKSVRLRFYLRGGDLYSFWISPWPSGESGGYTAGGGPGLAPSGIDEPVR